MHTSSLSPSRALGGVRSSIDDRKRGGVYPRINVRISDELQSAIDEVIDVTDAKSPSEVIRRALVIYHTLVMQKQMGNEPLVRRHVDGGQEDIPIFSDDGV